MTGEPGGDDDSISEGATTACEYSLVPAYPVLSAFAVAEAKGCCTSYVHRKRGVGKILILHALMMQLNISGSHCREPLRTRSSPQESLIAESSYRDVNGPSIICMSV